MSFRLLLEGFSDVRALVLGDVMLDRYVFGEATRISPEAPVMVVRQNAQRGVPGGAANVAKNIAALGAKAGIAGVTGEDEAGGALYRSLDEWADPVVLVEDRQRRTTVKTRIVADHAHQVLRIDDEDDSPLGPETSRALVDRVVATLKRSQLLLLSDYLKGILSESVVTPVIAAAKQNGVPVAANAKPASVGLFAGADLVSLNRRETEHATGLKIESVEDALHSAAKVRDDVGCRAVMVTMGDKGAVLCSDAWQGHVPAPRTEVYDTAGAGDTAVAAIALCLATVGLDSQGLALAVHASAKVVRHVGVAVPSELDLQELRQGI